MLCLDFFSFCDISWILTEFYNLCTLWLGWMCRSSPAVLVLTAHDGPFYPHLLQPSCFWPLLRKGPVSRRFYQLFLNSLLTLILSVWVPMGNRIKTRLCNTPCTVYEDEFILWLPEKLLSTLSQTEINGPRSTALKWLLILTHGNLL